MKMSGQPLFTLSDLQLFRTRARIGQNWCNADSRATAEVRDPATGKLLGTVPDMGAAETRRAIDAAADALPGWAAKSATERARRLRALNDLMLAHREDLAMLMTAEGGKPIVEARGEIDYSASFIEWFAEEGKRAYGDVIRSEERRVGEGGRCRGRP